MRRTLSLGRVGISGPERALPGPERPTLRRDAGAGVDRSYAELFVETSRGTKM